MWYSIYRENNKIHITNQGIKEITLKLYKNEEEVQREFINLLETKVVDLPKVEGVYRLEIFTEDNIINYIFPNYPEILKDLIDSLEQIFIGSNKSDCKSCNNTIIKEDSQQFCENLKKILFKILYYYTLVGRYYQSYFDNISKEVLPSLNEDYRCQSIQEMISGISTDTNFIKKILSLYYLSFYYGESDLSLSTSEEIKEKYKFKTISNYLVGISPIFIQDLCKEKVGVVTIGNGKKEFDKLAKVYSFTQRDFKELLYPNYYSSKMDSIEYFKVGKIKEGDFSEFRFKDKKLEEGQIITFEDLGKGFLKFYQIENIDYEDKAYFTFSIKTKLADRLTKLSKYEIIIK